MYTTLYQFLIFNKQLNLPGIGTFHLQKTSSELDFGNKIFTSPSYNFSLDNGTDVPTKKIFPWLSKVLNINEVEAIRKLNEFSFDLKNKLSVSGEVNWPPIGKHCRNNKGDIVLESSDFKLECEKPVMAEKVIRDKAEHTMLVGEMEKSVAEMEEILGVEEEEKDYYWNIAVVIAILAFLFIGFYLSEKGFQPSSFGNQSILIPK